jgi:hypothetical protein
VIFVNEEKEEKQKNETLSDVINSKQHSSKLVKGNQSFLRNSVLLVSMVLLDIQKLLI